MAVVEAEKALLILMILYGVAVVFGFLASIPMVMHVYPQSECLLFSHALGPTFDKLSYGTHASKKNEFTYFSFLKTDIICFQLAILSPMSFCLSLLVPFISLSNAGRRGERVTGTPKLAILKISMYPKPSCSSMPVLLYWHYF